MEGADTEKIHEERQAFLEDMRLALPSLAPRIRAAQAMTARTEPTKRRTFTGRTVTAVKTKMVPGVELGAALRSALRV